MYLGLGLKVKNSIVIFPHIDIFVVFSSGCRLKPFHVKLLYVFYVVWCDLFFVCWLIGAQSTTKLVSEVQTREKDELEKSGFGRSREAELRFVMDESEKKRVRLLQI